MTRRSTRTRRRGRGAFTLVEVLVASVVAVAVAGAAAAVLWQGMRANAAVASNRAAEDGLARLALAEALRADVASAAPLHGVPFRGDARGFSAARLRATPGAAPGPASAVRFAWEPAPDGRSMLRREAAAPKGDLALAPPVPHPAPDGAPRFSYAALVPDPADTNKPPALVWSDEWAETDACVLPALVRAAFGGTVLEFDVARAAPAARERKSERAEE